MANARSATQRVSELRRAATAAAASHLQLSRDGRKFFVTGTAARARTARRNERSAEQQRAKQDAKRDRKKSKRWKNRTDRPTTDH